MKKNSNRGCHAEETLRDNDRSYQILVIAPNYLFANFQKRGSEAATDQAQNRQPVEQICISGLNGWPNGWTAPGMRRFFLTDQSCDIIQLPKLTLSNRYVISIKMA